LFQFLWTDAKNSLLFPEHVILEYKCLIPQCLNLKNFVVFAIDLDWSDHHIFYNMLTTLWIGMLFQFSAVLFVINCVVLSVGDGGYYGS